MWGEKKMKKITFVRFFFGIRRKIILLHFTGTFISHLNNNHTLSIVKIKLSFMNLF